MQPNTFGRWIKKLRAEQDLTQERLAELVGCATPTLRAFEISTRRPSRDMAERIADALKMPADQREEFLRVARLAPEGQRVIKTNEAETSLPGAAQTPSRAMPPLSHITRLIGREAERSALQTLLRDEHNRLVTIVGAGGMGKTRLALDLTASLAEYFVDGAGFVALTALDQAQQIPVAVAQALNLFLQSGGDPTEQVVAALAGRQLLLTLDNFEHLLPTPDSISWVKQIIQTAPGIRLLVTSRERLRISGERVFELSGLALPTATQSSTPAAAELLFWARAQHADNDFVLDQSNHTAVARICQLVDGMPLGIELAAAWTHVLSCDEIADEIARNLDFLALADRDMSPRHRSMRAVFDHSWALLDDEERTALGRLATFRGGWSREAAQVVAGANLPLLAGLIDKSLVRRRPSDTPARYELHEVVRQYASDKRRSALHHPDDRRQPLAELEQDETWLAHYIYFYTLTVAARPRLYGREQLQWLQVLDAEHANLRAALDRCLSTQDFGRGLQLALQLEEYWYIRGHHREGLQRLCDFLGRDATRLSECDVAHGWVAATILAIADGNYTAAQSFISRSIDTIRRLGDQTALAKGLRYRGLIALQQGDYAAAEGFASEALGAAQAVNNRYEAATTLGHLAEIALIRQDYGRAQALGEQAVQILRLIEDKNQLAGSLRRLAQARIHQQQWDAAREDALESLALNNEIGDQRGTAASLVMLTMLLAATAQWSAVAQVLGAANYLLAQAHTSLLPADQLVYEEMWQRATAQFADFLAMYEAGRRLMAQERTQPYTLVWLYPWFA